MPLVLIGVTVWISLVVVALAMCRAASRADAAADNLQIGSTRRSDELAHTRRRRQIPAL